MEKADGMKKITQDIMASSKERDEALSKIKDATNTLQQEAADMVKDFAVSRSQTGRRLRQDLAKSNTDRKKEVAQNRQNAQKSIRDLNDSRKKSGEQLRKDLAQGTKTLSQNENNRKQEMKKTLGNIQSSRQESASALRKDLAEGKARMTSEVKETMKDAQNLINGFQTSHKTMGDELRKDLDNSRNTMKAQVDKMNQGFRQTRKEVQTELKEASTAWKEMRSTAGTQASDSKAVPEEQAELPVEITLNMEEKCLAIISQHPEGISLSDVAKELGIATIVLGKIARVLLEQGKVRKEEKTYFPVNT
jgi:hypothetical protein